MQFLSSLTVPDPSSTLIPSHTQIPYTIPPLPVLLSLSAYLYLLSATSTLSDYTTHAPLIGPLITGVLLGPSLAGLLSPSTQQAFISLGYLGLILIVFEAGLTTHIPLLISNIGVSTAAALTGVVLPIALSLALLHAGYGYTKLQSFAAGAALCSTSLGTTLALLTPRLKKTRVGCVLMCAALLDDVVGLVVAGIIANLAESDEGGVKWETVVRPVLVSIAFGVGCPALAWVVRRLIGRDWKRCSIFRYFDRRKRTKSEAPQMSWIYDTRTQLFFIVCTLSGFVAGSSYAGTSELFGAYLAGAFLAYIFGDQAPSSSLESSPIVDNQAQPIKNHDFSDVSNAYIEPVGSEALSPKLPTPARTSTTPADQKSDTEAHDSSPTLHSFNTHIAPILTPLLGPIFFASVGAALPVGSLFTTTTTTTRQASGADEGRMVAVAVKSHSVVWKGIVYALLMALGKMVVGVWMVLWRDRSGSTGCRDESHRISGFWGVWVVRPWKGLKRRAIEGYAYARTMRSPGNVMQEPKGSEGDVRREKETRTRMSGVHGDLRSAGNGFDLEEGTGDHVDVDASSPVQNQASSSLSSVSNPHKPTNFASNVPSTPVPSVSKAKHEPMSTRHSITNAINNRDGDDPSPTHAAFLLGLAMIARGEIALIVAQLARPLLVEGQQGEEPYAVVIWAIVVCTIGGAVGVGWLLGRVKKHER